MQLSWLEEFREKHFHDGLPKVSERQHYVPVQYLSSWKTGRRIAVKVKGRAPKLVGLRDVAVRSWFYEFPNLNYVELKTILDCITGYSSYERRVFTSLFAVSIIPQLAGRLVKGEDDYEAVEMIELLKERGMYDQSSSLCFNIRVLANRANPGMAEKVYELVRRNGSENILTAMENKTWSLWKKLLNGNAEILRSPHEVVSLVEYVFLQMYRTPKINQVFSQEAKGSDVPSNYAEAMIPYFRVIFAVQSSYRVMQRFRDYEIVLLRNASSRHLITSDYPFIHLAAELDSEFIFPISPTFAIYLGKKGNLESKYRFLLNLDCPAVDRLNRSIARGSVEQLFAKALLELEGIVF